MNFLRLHLPHRMNPLAKAFKPNPTVTFPIATNLLSLSDATIFEKICREWTEAPTLNVLLEQWNNYSMKTRSLLIENEFLSLILVNVSSLSTHLIDIIHLINNVNAPIIILNGTHHNNDTIKLFKSHMFNLNVFTSKGSNACGGVLMGIHKSIPVSQVTQYADVDNLLVLDILISQQKLQLVTCYSPPTEAIPLPIFEQILRRNPNTIITGDLNAKHSTWSLSDENHKGKCLFTWMMSEKCSINMTVINKFVPTSTRSKATIDIILAPAQLATDNFKVLPSIGSDHLPVV